MPDDDTGAEPAAPTDEWVDALQQLLDNLRGQFTTLRSRAEAERLVEVARRERAEQHAVEYLAARDGDREALTALRAEHEALRAEHTAAVERAAAAERRTAAMREQLLEAERRAEAIREQLLEAERELADRASPDTGEAT